MKKRDQLLIDKIMSDPQAWDLYLDNYGEYGECYLCGNTRKCETEWYINMENNEEELLEICDDCQTDMTDFKKVT